MTVINDNATTVSAVGLILTEDLLLVNAAMLTTTDMAMGTRPMAGSGLAVTMPEGIKRARAGIMEKIVTMRRLRSERRSEGIDSLSGSIFAFLEVNEQYRPPEIVIVDLLSLL